MLLSVITVTRNNAAGLKMTGRSLQIQQNAPEYEWIVIDGASTDNTPEVMAQFADLNPVFVSEADGGIYDAMNKGLARAQGDYVWFLNGGDCLCDMNVLRDVRQGIRDGLYPDLLYGDAREDGHIKPAQDFGRLARGMITHHQAMLYRRKTVGELRFDTRYAIAGDYDFTLRFLGEAERFHPMNRILCDFQTGGISQKRAAQGRRENYLIRKELGVVSVLGNAVLFGLNAAATGFKSRFPGAYWRLRSFWQKPSSRKTLAQWRNENPGFRPKPLFSKRKSP